MGSFYETESEILAMFGLLCSLEFMNFLYILKLFRLAFSLDDNKRGKNDVVNTYTVKFYKITTLCRPKRACCALKYLIEIDQHRTCMKMILVMA